MNVKMRINTRVGGQEQDAAAAQLPVWGAADGLWGANGPPKKPGVCHSPGFGVPQRLVPIGGGGPGWRPGNPGGAPGGPQGDDTDARGLVVVPPQP